MKLILGSQSQWRKQLLEQAGYTFEVMPADIDEKAIRSDNYEELPLLIARGKTKVLLEKIHEPAILITSDQVVVCNGVLREKPETPEKARAYLESYNTYPAQTNTAVIVTNTQTGKQAEAVDIAKVFFKDIPESAISELIQEGKVLTTAGGFIIEHPLLKPYIVKLEGDPTSISGLPIALTQKLISVFQ